MSSEISAGSAASQLDVEEAEAAADGHRVVSGDGAAPRASATGRSNPLLDRLPAPVAAFGAVVAVGGTQGGYFPNMWGPSALALLTLVALWLVAYARTDAGRPDVLFLGLLTALTSWVALSIAWSSAPVQSILDLERLLVLLAGVAAVLTLARRDSVADVGIAVALGATVLCGYGLATRLLPARFGGTFEPIAGYRLAEPVGYWNGLGILAAIGMLLAVGSAIAKQVYWRRALASVCLVVLAPTLYFTFSRGAWIALAVGGTAMLIVTPRRLATLGALAFLAPAPTLAVLAASRAPALTRVDARLDDAVSDGRHLLVVLVGLALLAGAAAVLLGVLTSRLTFSARSRRAIGAVLAAGAAAGVVAVFVQWGAPWTIADNAYTSFKQPPTAGAGSDPASLNSRLFTFSGSGRVDLWRVALSTAGEHPVLGVGAGSFERYWQQDARWSFKARDAHNLYLETLAELGPVGLTLLVGAILVGLGACVLSRRDAFVPAALGAFVAYVVHAGVDWDWELPGITLAAFTVGSLGLVARRRSGFHRLAAGPRVATGFLVAVVAAVAAVGFVGNDALDRAEYALEAGNPSAALREADLANRFAPWSPYPLTVEGEALLRMGRAGEARKAFREAIEVDDGYWRAWLGLGVASSGADRARAIREAKRLYPRSAEIAETERLLAKERSG